MATLYGGSAGETLAGGSGVDSLYGNGGNDTLTGAAGNDRLYGGDGNDSLAGGTGSDLIDGGAGFDTADYAASTSGVTVNLATGLGSGGDAAGDTLTGVEAVVGSTSADSLTGDGAANALYGGSGNDTLVGGGGADSLYGGTGTDTADYTAASAAVAVNLTTGLGSAGDAAGDVLSAIERLIGSGFDDTLTGSAAAETLTGGAGDDLLAGLGGADSLVGGIGMDTADYSVSAAAVTVSLASGSGSGGDAAGDTLSGIENLTGSALSDSLTGDGLDNELAGGAGNDTLTGAAGSDALFGGEGNDSLIGGAGADLLDGGAGIDTADYSASASGVTVDLATGTGSGGDAAGDTLSGIERVTGSGAADVLRGGAGAETLDGGAGNDTLAGGAGADSLIGGTGTDTADYAASSAGVTVSLTTGTGLGGDAAGDTLSGIENVSGTAQADALTGDANANQLYGAVGADSLYGAAGADSLYGGDGDDRIFGGAGSDLLSGGAGSDTADFSSGTTAVQVDLSAGRGYGGDAAGDTLSGIENVFGTIGADTLYGDGGNNVLSGFVGSDYISAGDGDDTLAGGAGADTLYGGAGMDYLDYSASNAAVSVNLDSWTALYGEAQGDVINSVDGIIGSAFNDTLVGFNQFGLSGDVFTNVFYGGAGNDWMDGLAGNDSLFGGNDADTVSGGAGDDTVSGDAGNDSVLGGDGNDLVLGGEGNDTVAGGAGADRLYGGAGNDLLQGGAGNDELWGDAGNDTFVGGDGSDTIHAGAGDYVDGEENGTETDILDLTGQSPFRIIRDSANPENGSVNFFDAEGNVTGTLTFRNIETIVMCFTPGTRIATPKGAVPVQKLRVGDLVVTRDHGAQRIRWIGRRSLTAAELAADPSLQPVRIRKGALGHGLPLRGMEISRQHRMLMGTARQTLFFGEEEVLVRAGHLTHLPGVKTMARESVTYIHLMFDRHELVMAEGAWSESFQPGERTLGGMEEEMRAEFDKLFPGIEVDRYEGARLTLKAHEARLVSA